MKISLIQFEPQLGNIQANIDAIAHLLDESESHLYVLPELANSGYNFDSKEQAFNYSESVDNSIFLDYLKAEAINRNTFFVTGFCERDDDKLYNSSVLIGPNGIIGIYRKLHLFLNEKDIFEPGDKGLPVFDTPLGKIGMLICFDWMFPEAWRHLALKGAQIIAHPSNLVLPYCQKVMPSYSLINRCFIATCNRIGTEKNLTFTGQSVIADINGDVLVEGTMDKSQLISADIDLSLALNKSITNRNNAFEDRRTDVYGNLNSMLDD
ncbi:nitrilase-related carbon-nitrogen hydrolase [Carboxylicivirga marina]|uniref:nitrilase-related carbon-nitrogen hydrolase n=1 Tax=Carboxylicivirga marina TaxID=2800988 RepID=UPI001F2D75C3|nr:nitrilase-related carbon-nitrogen hydrolase [Carboxylicivirga marina]